MKSVEKAIWYIESHYGQRVTLDDLARAASVSRYHLSRVFGYTTGIPVSRYLRDRRLSQAARALADGRRDILDLALGTATALTKRSRERSNNASPDAR